MTFFLKRLLYRLTSNWTFFWLIFLPPLAYAGIMALTPSLHTISSTITIPAGAHLAQTGEPTGVVPLSTLTSDSSNWESFVKANFNPQRIMGYPRGYGFNIPPGEINVMYEEALNNLSIKEDKNSVQTIYTGTSKALGNHLVFYYSTALYQRIQEGYKRQGSHFTMPLMNEPQMDPTTQPARIPWSRDRTRPTFFWLIAGVTFLLFIQIFRELTDTSYKSEKQIAEHTLLPILGCLPNLNAIPVAEDTPRHNDM